MHPIKLIEDGSGTVFYVIAENVVSFHFLNGTTNIKCINNSLYQIEGDKTKELAKAIALATEGKVLTIE